MFKITRKAAVFTFLFGALILSACGGAGEDATPTTDPNIIFTQAAITVQAQLTEMSALTPSATSTTGITPTVFTPTASTPFPTFAPLASNTPGSPPVAGGSSGDKCEYVSQKYEDGTSFNAGQQFDMDWSIKNTGTTTWSTLYSYRKYSGDDISDKSSYTFPKSVAPNETMLVTVDMTAPSKNGKFLENWVLTNAEGRNFCNFYFEMRVGGTATPGASKTPESGNKTATPVPGNETSCVIGSDDCATCEDIEDYFDGADIVDILAANDFEDPNFCTDIDDYDGNTLEYP